MEYPAMAEVYLSSKPTPPNVKETSEEPLTNSKCCVDPTNRCWYIIIIVLLQWKSYNYIIGGGA